MKNLHPIFQSFIHSASVAIYISAIAWFMDNGENIFGGDEKFIVPVILLLLFVFSAAVTGALVLGRPILLYLNGSKNEAVKFFLYTMGWLLLFIIIILGTVLTVR